MEWISVKERLPKPSVKVLVLLNEHYPVVAYWEENVKAWEIAVSDKDVVFYIFVNSVTHWCQLPEPPKEGEC